MVLTVSSSTGENASSGSSTGEYASTGWSTGEDASSGSANSSSQSNSENGSEPELAKRLGGSWRGDCRFRVISTPDDSAKLRALGFCARAVTASILSENMNDVLRTCITNVSRVR